MENMTQATNGPFSVPPKKGKRLWWLKLPKDFFTSNAVIKKMRKMPGGDTYVVVTLKILLLALDHQDFRIYYEGVEDTFVRDIALKLDETEESVAGALKVLIKQGWIVQEDEETLYSVKTEEMAGSESDSAERKRLQRQRDREKEALLVCDNVTPVSQECHSREEKRRKEKNRTEIEKMLEGKDLSELVPEAFMEGKKKSSPALPDVQQYAEASHFYAVSPDDFYGMFSSQDWTVEGKDITDWRSLYLELERLARNEEGEGGSNG